MSRKMKIFYMELATLVLFSMMAGVLLGMMIQRDLLSPACGG